MTTEVSIPAEGNSYPTLTVQWDEDLFGLTVAQCDEKLRAGEPRIEVLTASNPSMVAAAGEAELDVKRPREPRDRLRIISATLQEGEDLIVGQRLREILAGTRGR